jgi:hypothetical protein
MLQSKAGMSCSETKNIQGFPKKKSNAGNEYTTEERTKSYRVCGEEVERQTGGWIDGAAAQASPLHEHDRAPHLLASLRENRFICVLVEDWGRISLAESLV